MKEIQKEIAQPIYNFAPRQDWKVEEVLELFALPFNDLIFKAAEIHRANHNQNAVQISTLLSIKTGSCPENCKYCPQSAHYNTGLERMGFLLIFHFKKNFASQLFIKFFI